MTEENTKQEITKTEAITASQETKVAEPKPVETKVEAPKRMRADKNVIFIGNKPFMNYVTAVVMQFTTQNSNDVIIKSRGKFITKAVDVAEVVRRRFLSDQIMVKDVKINSENFENKEGKQVSVSTLDVTLSKIN